MKKNSKATNRTLALVIEDDLVLGPALLQRLVLEGYDARLVSNGANAVAFLKAQRPDFILSDIRLPDSSGEQIWRHIIDLHGPLPVWFITAFGEVEQAVRLVKAGARDYLTKPVDIDALIASVEEAVHRGPATQRDAQTVSLGESAAIAQLELNLRKAARSHLPVLLVGETGSGKEVAARFLHQCSVHQGEPFVAVNCAAIPRDLAESLLFGHEKGAFTGATGKQIGAFEEAGAGTLFLDEVAEMPLELQAKLLRAIETRLFRPLGARKELSFHARIVSATHKDLKAAVAEGQFREDLYFRLNVIELNVPPLRDRREEIEKLALRFLKGAGNEMFWASTTIGDGDLIARDAVAALLDHDWPGNIRELRNRVERAAALAETLPLRIADFFPESSLDRGGIGEHADSDCSLDAVAREAIRQRVLDALKQTNGNQSEAARLLGVSRTTIWKYSR